MIYSIGVSQTNHSKNLTKNTYTLYIRYKMLLLLLLKVLFDTRSRNGRYFYLERIRKDTQEK